METVAAREMRLARLLVFSALAARAVADAAAAADEDPSRWSLRALTGGRYDAAAAARPADASSTRNVTNVQLWFHIMENFDEFSLFAVRDRKTQMNASVTVMEAIAYTPGGFYGPFDERNEFRTPIPRRLGSPGGREKTRDRIYSVVKKLSCEIATLY